MDTSVLKKDKNTGEIYLANADKYYAQQRSIYGNYVEFEREYVKRFLATTSPVIQAKFPTLCAH